MEKDGWICYNETMWAWNELWNFFKFDHIIIYPCIYLSFFLFWVSFILFLDGNMIHMVNIDMTRAL